MNRIFLASLAPTLLLGGIATAAPAAVPGLIPLPERLPARCEPLARVPASATIPGPQLAAHVSVASCLAEEAMNALTLAPDTGSIARLDEAVAPSMALLDSVIGSGDAYWTLIAQDAKRDLYVGMIVRERDTNRGTDLAVHDALEPKLARWQDDASQAMVAIARLVRDNPTLARRDEVIGRIIAQAPDERHAQMARLVR